MGLVSAVAPNMLLTNASFFRRAAYLLRRRTATTTFRWVKGHDGVEGNEECDGLAKEGAANPIESDLDMNIPNNFNAHRAKVAALTQSLAYRGIMKKKQSLLRPSSLNNIQLTREAVKRITGYEESDVTIWLSLRQSTIRPKVCTKQCMRSSK